MCDVIDMKSRKVIKSTMTVADAESLVGEGLMVDELISTKDLCADDVSIVEACDVLLDMRKAN